MAQSNAPLFIVDAAANLPTGAGVEGITAYAQDTNAYYVWSGSAWVLWAPGSGIDGDKGDITISGSGATYTIDNDVVSDAKLRNSGPLSVIGRAANSTGDPADISATAASAAVLRESGSTLGFGTVATAGLANDAVTFAKMQNIATQRLIGRNTAGTGDPGEVTIAQALAWGSSIGYAVNVQAAGIAGALTDAQTLYFGGLAGFAPSTVDGAQRLYLPSAGTITAAYIFARATAVAGSNESWTLSVRLNSTSDTTIQALSSNAANRVWSNTALSISVSAGNFIEIKSVNPTWATNPDTVYFGGTVYVKQT